MNKYLLIVSLVMLVVICGSAAAKPLKVYILAGQSNMEGHAEVRTFKHVGMDPETAPMLKDMLSADGDPRELDDVYISYLTGKGGWKTPLKSKEKQGKLTVGFGAQGTSQKIGPEFTFGIYMHKKLNEPILLIKTAWGGRSLNADFRPPSAGPYVWPKELEAKLTPEKREKKKQATGRFYRLMMDHVKKVLEDPGKFHPAYNAEDGYEVAGFVWFQGFNDLVDKWTYSNRNQPGGYGLYSELLCHLIRDVRKDLNAPEMKFIIGVLGTGGKPTKESEANLPEHRRNVPRYFRKAMAAPASMPQFKDSVAAVYTDDYWDYQLEKLEMKMNKVKAKFKPVSKKGNLSKKEIAEYKEKLISEFFTKKEWEIFEAGRSNQGYHYFGSAKTIGQIGKAFAEAMIELQCK